MRAEYHVPGPLETLPNGEQVAIPAGRCRVPLRSSRFVTRAEAPVELEPET
ncbi:hypothetical protein ACFWNN_41695 [Lentzea sp. NPDC058450]|uniref:hypothetical protein n=1 Tax=Lentzea sp. NPDC058450 TaxID=3346505 RepID=UPI003652E745